MIAQRIEQEKGSPENIFLKGANSHLRRTVGSKILLITGKTKQMVSSVMGAFPLSHPGRLISIRDNKGEEIGILDDINTLDAESRHIMEKMLERSYFMPAITDIHSVKEELSVEVWEVETDKGRHRFEVRHVRQNVRRLGGRRLLIKDVDGNRYQIKDWATLPVRAQKIITDYL